MTDIASTHLRMGVLTPSSNTALEPLTSALVGSYQAANESLNFLKPSPVSAHFARFKVTEIALSEQALGQFQDDHILSAAAMLADAKVDVIGWSGTAAGWMGFDKDELLVERIQQRTGIPATTAILALNDALRMRGIERIGIVSPYTSDVQQRIAANYERMGIEVVAETHENIRVNHEFGMLPPELILQRLRTVAQHPRAPQALITYCTNLRAAHLAPAIEAEFGIPLLDTVSTTVWGMLRQSNWPTQPLVNWGQLFAQH
jgi:maleate isomerase